MSVPQADAPRQAVAPTAPAHRPEDERLPFLSTVAYGLQHVLTMYGGIIAPPLIIGTAAGVSPTEVGLLIAACLFMGGLATLLQTLGVPFFGSQLPLVQGVSFAGVATMLAIVADGGGLPAVFGSVIAASLIGLVIAPFFSRIVRFFPPVVTGVVITTIGLTLIPVAANWSMGGNASADDYGDPANLGLAGLTLVIVMVLSKVGNATISRLSILLAIVLGTVVAAIFGMTDFSAVGDGDIFAFPTPFAFGAPEFQLAAIVSMTIVILVTLTETTADIIAVGEITGSKIDSKRIASGLRADMLSSAVAPIFNTFTQSAFAQNVGLVAVTKVKSRFVVAAGGGILVLLGVLPVLGRVVTAVPMAVLGGAGIVLFGTVAASGIRTLSKVRYSDNMNLIIVATSIGFGVLPVVQPTIYDQFPSWFQIIFHSGISSAAIMAIVLNLVFNHWTRGNSEQGSVFVASGSRVIRAEVLQALAEGDRVEDGHLVDCDGIEVPVAEVPDADDPAELRDPAEPRDAVGLRDGVGTSDPTDAGSGGHRR
ncbi:nucleobase:cation symporter-2 family protein [Cellulomonas sp. PhB143]|uniref:nucleobase:cation symporter-2 family protein n=1 Tax=Cellulomonas sp. PhB143 TaxID=2485186 RepID=UPI000F4A45CF|nr:nucleobase:cation symporter-2 family protein [Cellulomonas sp. PhB143]ROS78942.1 NCS2 family nucleobase:cation symporter-2 [Cellulomonas sp. PhB143]